MMTEPYLGEIQILGFTFPPYQWAFAGGQLVPIQQNSALFALIGTLYGGNGQTNFQLPNLASRQACGAGQGPTLTNRELGETFGSFQVSLTNDEIPSHNHIMTEYVPTSAETVGPTVTSGIGTVESGNFTAFASVPGAPVAMNPMMVQPAGSNIPHNNIQPYLGLNFSIALAGTFPSFG
jgi:microcystin-dependent protein